MVITYELDPVDKAYVSTGVHHDRLKLSAPYDIDIDIGLTAIDELWARRPPERRSRGHRIPDSASSLQ